MTPLLFEYDEFKNNRAKTLFKLYCMLSTIEKSDLSRVGDAGGST